MSVAKATAGETQVELYSHKLFAPQQFSGAIRRQAILDRLIGNTHARVVFLQGPAGHGKSTALQQLKSEFESRGALTAWLTFDKADNDIRRFSIHFQAVLAALLHEAGADDQELTDTPPRRRRSDWLIGQLLQLGRPVVMFFDDFQTIDDRLILSFFRELFERVPDGIRLIIGSRSIPEVGLARLVINHQAVVLRSDDLRFSEDEVVEFFSADPQLALSRGEIDAIFRRSDGWPAALQLFRLALVSPAVRQSLGDLASYRPRELAEYLAENVLNLQTPRLQEFLLKTSLLPTMTAPLCDAVTGWSDSQSLLLQLEQSGLFVRALDSDLRWFKYHPLFSSFLAEHLRETAPEAALEVHRRAARWCLGEQLHEATVRHALACRDFTLAADTMTVWFAGLIADAQLVTVEHWCSQLPFEEIARRPPLMVELAYALVFLRRYERLRPLIELLESGNALSGLDRTTRASVVLSMAAISADDVAGAFAHIDGLEVRTPHFERFNAFELGAAANLLGYRAMTSGDFEAVREYLTLARAHNARGAATFSAGYTIGIRGVSFMAQGQLQEALEVFRQGMAEQRMHMDKSFASAALVSCYIWGLYEANQLDRVEALFGQYRDTISESVLLDFLAVACISVSRTYDARGRISKALETLDEAETLGHSNGWHRLVRVINWERIRRALLAGAIDRAVAIADRNPAAPAPLPGNSILFSEDIEGESLGRIRLAIHLKHFDQAAQWLAAEFGRHASRIHRQLKLHLLDAQLQDAKSQHNAAHRSLRKALQLAQTGGFVRAFLDEGERVLRLLREEYQTVLDASSDSGSFGADREFIETLLQASGVDLSRSTPRSTGPARESLTDREKEILTFLANGVSNKEMASRVFLSENTVKFHLKNIYSKLAVDSRLKAITAARQRGLIE